MKYLRKEIKLSETVVEKIQAKADNDERSFKQYLELFVNKLADGKIVILKGNGS